MPKNTLLEKVLLGLIFIDIVLAPLYVVRWSYLGTLPTTLLETLLLLTFTLWLILRLNRRDLSIPRSRFDISVILFLIAGTISIFAGTDWFAGLGRWRAFILEPILFYYLLVDVARLLGKDQLKRLLTTALMTLAVWLSTLGILQYFFHVLIVDPTQYDRAHAVYNIGNQLAMAVGPILLMLLARKNTSRGRYLVIGLVILLTFAFIATESTGGLLGLVAGLTVILMVKIIGTTKTTKILRGSVIAGTIAFIVFLTQIGNFTPRVNNPWIRPGGTDKVRLCLWQGAFDLVKDKPIFGAGIEGFSRLYGEQYYTCDGEPFEEADNIILNFWTKTGLLGLIGMIWLLVLIFKNTDENAFPYQLAFVYWFVHGMVDVPYFKNDLTVYWWVFAVLVLLSTKNEATPTLAPNKK